MSFVPLADSMDCKILIFQSCHYCNYPMLLFQLLTSKQHMQDQAETFQRHIQSR